MKEGHPPNSFFGDLQQRLAQIPKLPSIWLQRLRGRVLADFDRFEKRSPSLYGFLFSDPRRMRLVVSPPLALLFGFGCALALCGSRTRSWLWAWKGFTAYMNEPDNVRAFIRAQAEKDRGYWE